MKIIIGFCTLLLFEIASAKVSHFENIQKSIADREIEREIQTPNDAGISFDFFKSLLPTDKPDELDCKLPLAPKPSPSPSPSPSTQYEILLIVESGNPDLGHILDEETHRFQPGVSNDDLKELFSSAQASGPRTLNSGSVLSWAELTSKSVFGNFDLNTDRGKSFVIEALIQTASLSPNLSEAQLNLQMANAISTFAKSEDDKYAYLTLLSSRLYQNYNDARNPNHNNSKNNPDHIALPTGDLTQYQLFSAAAEGRKYGGGVCNDISESLAQLGTLMFPDKDVLAINGGTHFALLVVGKNDHRIINWSETKTEAGMLELLPEQAKLNFRINKVQNGKLKQIATLDTQLGHFLKSVDSSDEPALKSGGDVREILNRWVQTKTGASGKVTQNSVNLGAGQLQNSQVMVVVAKKEISTEKSKSYLGLGSGVQLNHVTDDPKPTDTQYLAHMLLGYDRRLIHYQNPKLELSFSSGVHNDALIAIDQQGESVVSGNALLKNHLKLSLTPSGQSGGVLNTSIQSWSAVGVRNWGKTTGLSSDLSVKGVLGTMGELNLSLKQIVADVDYNLPIKKDIKSISKLSYQGSPVGTKIDLSTGIQVKAKNGGQIFVFTGYATSDIKGFQTRYSLLSGLKGFQTGASYQGKKGSVYSGSVTGLAPGQKPYLSGTAIIPIFKKTPRIKK